MSSEDKTKRLLQESLFSSPLPPGEEDEPGVAVDRFGRFAPVITDYEDEDNKPICVDIASYMREFTRNLGSGVAVNEKFICYPVRHGQIRLIGSVSGQIELLKTSDAATDGKAFLCDMQFSPVNPNILGSVGGNGQVTIWTIGEPLPSPIQPGTVYPLPWKAALTLASDESEYTRIRWSTTNASNFLLIRNETLEFWDLNSPDAPRATYDCPDVIADACYSPSGKRVAVATTKGGIRVLNSSAVVVASVEDSETVQRVFWTSNDVEGEVLVTVGKEYSVAKLWEIGAASQIVAISALVLDAGGKILHCAEIDKSGSFLVVCYTSERLVGRHDDNGMFVIHIQKSAEPRFDYVSVVYVRHPIVSLNVLNETAGNELDPLTTDQFDVVTVQTKPIQRFRFTASRVWRPQPLDSRSTARAKARESTGEEGVGPSVEAKVELSPRSRNPSEDPPDPPPTNRTDSSPTIPATSSPQHTVRLLPAVGRLATDAMCEPYQASVTSGTEPVSLIVAYAGDASAESSNGGSNGSSNGSNGIGSSSSSSSSDSSGDDNKDYEASSEASQPKSGTEWESSPAASRAVQEPEEIVEEEVEEEEEEEQQWKPKGSDEGEGDEETEEGKEEGEGKAEGEVEEVCIFGGGCCAEGKQSSGTEDEEEEDEEEEEEEEEGAEVQPPSVSQVAKAFSMLSHEGSPVARMSPTSFPSHPLASNFPTPDASAVPASTTPATSSATTSFVSTVETSRDTPTPNTQSERSQKERVESNLLNRLDRMFTKHFQHIAAQMMKEKSQREAEEKEKIGLISREINSSLASIIRRELDAGANRRDPTEMVNKALTAGLQRQLPKALEGMMQKEVAKALTSMRTSLPAPAIPTEVLQKSLDASLANVFSNPDHARGGPTAQEVADTLVEPIQECFKDCFAKMLIPAFEASSRVMLQQVHGTLQAHFAQQLVEDKKQAGATEKVDHSLTELKKAVITLAQVLDRMKTTTDAQVKRAQDYQVETIQMLESCQQKLDGVIENVSLIAKATKAGAVPIVDEDPFVVIQRAVEKENFNEAFVLALGQKNMELLVWLCSLLDSRKLLGADGPPKLTTAVVASLTQQLTFDLESDTNLKLAWLAAGISCLEKHPDPAVGHHLPELLREVSSNLSGYARNEGLDMTNPKTPIARSIKSAIVRAQNLADKV